MANSYCRACGARIIFIKTKAGKFMPCNPDPIPYWQRDGASGKVITTAGEVVSCDLEGKRERVTGVGRISHFATCPSARKFKK